MSDIIFLDFRSVAICNEGKKIYRWGNLLCAKRVTNILLGQYEVLLSVQPFVYECARVYERERKCVYLREGEGERESMCACVTERKRGRK